MTPLRKKMIDDLVLRGLSERTQRRYADAVAGLAKFYNCSPDTLNDEQVQRYLLHLRQERGLSASSTNVTVHALRFFFHKTLRREPAAFQLPAAREPSKLPQILSQTEVARMLFAVSNLKHRALLMTTYATGLPFTNARKAAGLDDAVTFHTLRHTAVTRLCASLTAGHACAAGGEAGGSQVAIDYDAVLSPGCR